MSKYEEPPKKVEKILGNPRNSKKAGNIVPLLASFLHCMAQTRGFSGVVMRVEVSEESQDEYLKFAFCMRPSWYTSMPQTSRASTTAN